MHQCAIECYKDNTKNIESVEACSENCSKEVMAARDYVHKEFNKWQVRYYPSNICFIIYV